MNYKDKKGDLQIQKHWSKQTYAIKYAYPFIFFELIMTRVSGNIPVVYGFQNEQQHKPLLC